MRTVQPTMNLVLSAGMPLIDVAGMQSTVRVPAGAIFITNETLGAVGEGGSGVSPILRATNQFSPALTWPIKAMGFYGPEISSEVIAVLLHSVPSSAVIRETNHSGHITLIDTKDADALVARAATDVTLKSAIQAGLDAKATSKPVSKGQVWSYVARIALERQETLSSPVVTGIGSATANENTVYYAVVSWPAAQALRAELGLGSKDFHMTLASTQDNSTNPGKIQDVHGVSKAQANVVQFSEK